MRKIDCNVTENFLKEKRRMCKVLGCARCVMSKEMGSMFCREYCEEYPKEAIAFVQKWSDEHPQLTMLDKFKEQHPNAVLAEATGLPFTCPHKIGYEKFVGIYPSGCNRQGGDCANCWNRPYEEQNDD